MNILTVYYPRTPETHFNVEYYVEHHVGFIRTLWADLLDDIQLLQGADTLRGGEVPFHLVAILTFKSADAMKQAFGMEGAKKMPGDTPNFTNTAPTMTICEAVGA